MALAVQEWQSTAGMRQEQAEEGALITLGVAGRSVKVIFLRR